MFILLRTGIHYLLFKFSLRCLEMLDRIIGFQCNRFIIYKLYLYKSYFWRSLVVSSLRIFNGIWMKWSNCYSKFPSLCKCQGKAATSGRRTHCPIYRNFFLKKAHKENVGFFNITLMSNVLHLKFLFLMYNEQMETGLPRFEHCYIPR